ncbi:MAG: FtsW/RodA/SpoVE family cell cycle protein [Bdellovibrio bacteriovorus]
MSAPPLALAAAWARRRGERHLLLASLGSVTIGFILVLGSAHEAGGSLMTRDLLPLLTYAASLIGLHLALVLLGFRGDQVLVGVAAFLAGLGLLAQTRMGTLDRTEALVPGPLLLPMGLLVMVATAGAFMDGRHRQLARGFWLWGGLSLALVVLLLAIGQRFRGAVFGLGLVTPTELLKVTVVLFLAGYLDRHGRALGLWHPRLPLPPWQPLWPLLAYWSGLMGLLLIQRDLGMVAILSVPLLALLVMGSGRGGYLAYGALAALILGFMVLGVFEHGGRRIGAWLDPFEDPTGDGWQILQGLSGLYAGGLWGEGFGQGSPGYTPIAESDFIYTVLGEELGFIGSTVVILFYLILFQRALQIATQSRCGFGRLLAAGVTAVLATQTFLNVAGVTKLIPLTGVTLPLISQGGASLITTFTGLGLLLAVSDGAPASPARQRKGRSTAKAPPAASTSAQKTRRAPRRSVNKERG